LRSNTGFPPCHTSKRHPFASQSQPSPGKNLRDRRFSEQIVGFDVDHRAVAGSVNLPRLRRLLGSHGTFGYAQVEAWLRTGRDR
jgi:hypothetical protein